MKYAIAAINKNEHSKISARAGRAPYYLIFNENKELVETISNPFAVGGGGAGFAVAKMLADKDVDCVIAGSFGPNMASALDAKGIKHFERQGIAREALNDIS